MADGEIDLFGIPREVRNDIWLVALRARLITEESHRAAERAQAQARRTRWLCARSMKRRRGSPAGQARGRVIRFRRTP